MLMRMEDRWKEYDKSSVSELGNLRFHGGKTWIAPSNLIKEDVRLFTFPFRQERKLTRAHTESTVPTEPDREMSIRRIKETYDYDVFWKDYRLKSSHYSSVHCTFFYSFMSLLPFPILHTRAQ